MRHLGMIKGSALITALCLLTFLLTLGATRLLFAEENYRVAVKEERDAQAYYLALSGLYYYEINQWNFNQTSTGGSMEPESVPAQDSTHFFQLSMVCPCSVLGPMGVTSRGYVLNANKKVIAERTLQIQNGFLGTMHEVK